MWNHNVWRLGKQSCVLTLSSNADRSTSPALSVLSMLHIRSDALFSLQTCDTATARRIGPHSASVNG
jgi:hypothetical protein